MKLAREVAGIGYKPVQIKFCLHWLQKSWRPIVMLAFTFIVLLGAFIPIPLLENTSEFWNLLEIGLGGYVIGRSIEKVTGKIRKI